MEMGGERRLEKGRRLGRSRGGERRLEKGRRLGEVELEAEVRGGSVSREGRDGWGE